MTVADPEDELPAPRGPNEIRVTLGKSGEIDPNVFREAITRNFDGYGLAWVEKLIGAMMPGTIVVPPLIASGYYGKYFQEFDHWRAARRFMELRSFQGVLVVGKPALASAWKLPNKDAISGWYGKKYQGNLVSILCIDDGLIRWIAGSFFHLIVRGVDPLGSFRTWLIGDDNAHDLPSIEGALGNGVSDELVGRSRRTFREEVRALEFYFGPAEATAALANVISPTGATHRELDWIWSYCESMTLHFLQGHEFGHYAFAEGTSVYLKEVRELVAIVTPPGGDGALREEVFCDILGLENCCFQMEFFKVPPVFAVFVPIWGLSLIRGTASSRCESSTSPAHLEESLLARMRAIALYWRHRNKLLQLPAFGDAAHNALHGLDRLGLAVGEIAARIDKD